MYLHLGNNYVIPEKDIIGIFDMDNTTVSKHTRRLLAQAEKNGRVITVSPDLPKSFVLCKSSSRSSNENCCWEYTVYLCQISSSALAGRAEQGLGVFRD